MSEPQEVFISFGKRQVLGFFVVSPHFLLCPGTVTVGPVRVEGALCESKGLRLDPEPLGGVFQVHVVTWSGKITYETVKWVRNPGSTVPSQLVSKPTVPFDPTLKGVPESDFWTRRLSSLGLVG